MNSIFTLPLITYRRMAHDWMTNRQNETSVIYKVFPVKFVQSAAILLRLQNSYSQSHKTRLISVGHFYLKWLLKGLLVVLSFT